MRSATPPIVSICIPAYNEPELLARCLQSIRIQDFSDFEVVVTDDSTTDEIETICCADNMGGRLIYHRNHQRLGSPENWNEGLRRSTGSLVKILHHDDWFASPQSLGKLVYLLQERPGTDFAFSATKACLTKGEVSFLHQPSQAALKMLLQDPRVITFGNFIGAPSVTLYRRHGIQSFDRRLKWLVDTDFYLQILMRNGRVAYSPEYLLCTHVGGQNQVTRSCHMNPDIELSEFGILWRKWFSDGVPEPLGLRAAFYWTKLLARLGIVPWAHVIEKTGYLNLSPRIRKQVRLAYPVLRGWYAWYTKRNIY